MSISMNNHETRIKALESKRHGLNFTLLTPSPVFLNRSWKHLCKLSGFNSLMIVVDHGYNNSIYSPGGFVTSNVNIIPLSLFSLWGTKNIMSYGTYGSSEYTTFKFDGTNLTGYSTQSGANPSDNKCLVWGLNLYYKLREIVFSNILREVI